MPQHYCERRSHVPHLLVHSVEAAPEDSGGLGSSRHVIGKQLGGQRAAQDTAEDPQKQPCEC